MFFHYAAGKTSPSFPTWRKDSGHTHSGLQGHTPCRTADNLSGRVLTQGGKGFQLILPSAQLKTSLLSLSSMAQASRQYQKSLLQKKRQRSAGARRAKGSSAIRHYSVGKAWSECPVPRKRLSKHGEQRKQHKALQHLHLIVAQRGVLLWQTSNCWLELKGTRDVEDDEHGESCLDPSQAFREKIKGKGCCQGKNHFSLSWALFSTIVREE